MKHDRDQDFEDGREDHRREQLAEAVVFAHESTAGDQSALAQAKANAPHAQQSELAALEATAALVTAAFVQRKSANPPSSLQMRLAAAGLEFCAQRRPVSAPVSTPRAAARAPRSPQQAPAPRPASLRPTSLRPNPIAVLSGALLGLAAGFLFWLAVPPRTADVPVDPRSPAEQLASLLAADPSLLRLHWQHGTSPFRGQVTGEVVWSQQDQRGYLTFHGLPALDEDHRFQLWIVDGQREGAPVDGGLFAIRPGSDTTVVAIDARLPIGKPAAFVVTVEAKSGAVVSKQEHVVAIASL